MKFLLTAFGTILISGLLLAQPNVAGRTPAERGRAHTGRTRSPGHS